MENNKLTMDLASDSDVDVANEKHIHATAIQFEGADKMTQTWTSFAGGKTRYGCGNDLQPGEMIS